MDVSKLFFSVAPPEGGYYAIDKKIYDRVLGDDSVAYNYYMYTEVTVDGVTYIIVDWSRADDNTDNYDFDALFADFWGEYGYYLGGFSTIENHQG